MTCCYAVQNKVWATDPDGNKWEVYVVLDNDAARHHSSQSACCSDARCCEDKAAAAPPARSGGREGRRPSPACACSV